MKILITGGHLTPALSFIDFVQKEHPQDSLIFVGREFSQDTLQQKAVESYEVEKRKIPFISFRAIRFGPHFFRSPLKNIAHFIKSVRQARAILAKKKPAVILSFGGYVAVPFVLAARRMSIPVVTHEQTFVSGFANRVISFFAQRIALTFSETRSSFPAHKTVVTGNPLRAGVFLAKHRKPSWLPKKISKPIILVMGGNQGSRVMNEVIATTLPELVKEWTIVHQCGRPTKQHQYQELLERRRKRLPKKLRNFYFVSEWIDDNDLFWLYQHAFGAISRSGANAAQELAAANLPAIFIPLPFSHSQEQRKNARWLVAAGGAILLEQTALTSKNLLKSLEKLRALEKPMRENLSQIVLPKNAAKQLYEVVASVL